MKDVGIEVQMDSHLVGQIVYFPLIVGWVHFYRFQDPYAKLVTVQILILEGIKGSHTIRDFIIAIRVSKINGHCQESEDFQTRRGVASRLTCLKDSDRGTDSGTGNPPHQPNTIAAYRLWSYSESKTRLNRHAVGVSIERCLEYYKRNKPLSVVKGLNERLKLTVLDAQ